MGKGNTTEKLIDNAIVTSNWKGYEGLNIINSMTTNMFTIIVKGIQVIQYRHISGTNGFSFNIKHIVRPSEWKYNHMEELPSSVADGEAMVLVLEFIVKEFSLVQDAQYLIDDAEEDARLEAEEAHSLKYPKYMSMGSSMSWGYYFDHAKRGDGFTLTCGRLMISNATKKSLQGVKKQLLGEGHTPEEISIY